MRKYTLLLALVLAALAVAMLLGDGPIGPY
jgi:hypothetical protein